MIRVPVAVRDRVRGFAESRQETFGQVISHGLDLVEREQFWAQIAMLTPDDEYRAEFASWDAGDFGAGPA